MGAALTFVGVEKRFGAHQALAGLTFTVPKGSITGFVGPNGAGKTTTFSVVSGFLRPDAGTVDILGLPAFDPYLLKGRLGVLPQDAELSLMHTPTELLRHLARLQGIPSSAQLREVTRVVELVRLEDRMHHRIGHLSHGMRRRVAIATALLGAPELVLLDEPMAGLDPLQAKSLREALSELQGSQTLVISSHNLDELERFCDHVVMIDKGRTLREGAIAEVTERGEWLVWEVSAQPPLELLHQKLPGHTFTFVEGQLSHRAPAGVDLDATSLVVMGLLVERGIGLRATRRGRGLESRFLEDATR